KSERVIPRILRPEERDERFAISPHQEYLEGSKHDPRWKTFRRHERVEDQDVDEDSAENRKSQRDEASDKEKKASNHLKPANDINITAGKEHSRVVASQVVR